MILQSKNSYLMEGVEPECHLMETLIMRQKSIPFYTNMGPPDLCYLVLE
jgi:hypothetical protein